MKFKYVAAAAVLLAAGSAGATTTSLGAISIGVPTNFQGTVMPPGGFSDIFTFSLPANGGSGYSVADFSLNLPGIGTFGTLMTTLSLWSNGPDGVALTPDDVMLHLASAAAPGVPGLSFPYAGTPAGGYYLNVAGITTGTLGGLYSGSISVSPVPEPETWALMLAGVGAVGFLARRRKAI